MKLPSVSGRACVSALQRAGFIVQRQNGSHIVMRHDDPYALTVVPDHRTIKPGTLRNIIRQAGLTVDQFINLLR